MADKDHVFVIFLKHESLWVEQCQAAEVFAIAREHDAGICGVHADESVARAALLELKREQQRLWKDDASPVR